EAIEGGVFRTGEADVDRRGSVVEPGAATQIVGAAVVSIGRASDLPGLVHVVKGIDESKAAYVAVFVSAAASVLRACETDVDGFGTVAHPDAVAQILAAAVVAPGETEDLPGFVQLLSSTVLGSVATCMFGTGEADHE